MVAYRIMDKPLPDIPQPSVSTKQLQPTNWVNLTIDGRNHLRRFILYALEESQDVISLDNREQCAFALEGALVSLGERMFMGGWLPGLRRMRRRKAVEFEEERERQREREKGTPKATESVHTAPKRDSTQRRDSHDAGYFALVQDGVRQPVSEPFSQQQVLEALRLLVEKSAIPVPKLTAKHLVLTVASFKPATSDEQGVRCIFTSGTFAIPTAELGTSAGTTGEILYGLDTWGECLTCHVFPIFAQSRKQSKCQWITHPRYR